MGKGSKKTQKKTISKNILLWISCIGVLGIIIGILLFYPKDEKWIQKGNIISKGKESYEIGDYYEYDETAGGEYEDLEEVKWKVIGVDEDGHLLLLSASSIGKLTVGVEDNFTEGLNAYMKAKDDMTKLVRKYAKGKNVVYSRNVQVQDVLKILNLEKENFLKENATITYYWNKDGKLYFKNENGEEGISPVNHETNFFYFDENQSKWMMPGQNLSDEELTKIVTLKGNRILFNSTYYDDEKNEILWKYDITDKARKMLFEDEKDVTNEYWTEDRYVDVRNNSASFGYSIVNNEGINARSIVHSNGVTKEFTESTRAVIAIK